MIVMLQGRLGNQMFQVAFGKSVAAKRGEEILFTKTRVEPRGEYGLDGFVTDIKYAPEESSITFNEKCFFQYDPDVFEAPRGATFDGFWQSEKYFNEELVRKEFILRNPLTEESQRLADEIQEAGDKSTFIGCRRNDELQQIPNLSLDLSYYTAAIDFVRQRREGAKLFVFTDNPEWAAENFPTFTLVNHTNWKQKYEDMQLMSLCRNAVLANSTFHWWGCWLGDRQSNRICIAPKRWFARGSEFERLRRDIIPSRWIEVPEGI
jgi:hypothetical protein